MQYRLAVVWLMAVLLTACAANFIKGRHGQYRPKQPAYTLSAHQYDVESASRLPDSNRLYMARSIIGDTVLYYMGFYANRQMIAGMLWIDQSFRKKFADPTVALQLFASRDMAMHTGYWTTVHDTLLTEIFRHTSDGKGTYQQERWLLEDHTIRQLRPNNTGMPSLQFDTTLIRLR